MSESLICKKISAIMSDITYISKDRKNINQGYQFRGVDDIYNELHSIMAKYMVFTVPEVLDEKSEERQGRSGGTLIYRILKIKYTFFCEDGSYINAIVVGEGMDSGDKASNKAMAVAHKYALLQVFCIPTDDPKDPENDSPDPLPKKELPYLNRITEEQALDITMLGKKKGINFSKILEAYKVKDLIEIENKYYQEIIDKLNSKPDKNGGV
jgi:hypothetical protein